MKYVNIAAAAIAFAAAVPTFAGTTQVVAGNGLNLTQAAAVKFNNDTRQDDRQTVAVVPGKGGNVSQLAASAGIAADEATSMSLGQIVLAKVNREARGDDKQAMKGGAVTMSTRSPSLGGNEQLAASAGMSADGKSLTEIAAAKFARDTNPNH
jgi:hypothetical protein